MNFEPLKVSHAADIYRLWSDFDAVKFTNWTYTPTPSGCSERVAKVVAFYGKEPRHFGPYFIRSEDGRFLGLIGADFVESSEDEYEVWYFLCREEWGKGFATQALQELIRRLRESGRVKRAIASAVVENIASARLLERAGFTRVGVTPGEFKKHGLTCDVCSYVLDVGGTS